MSANSFGDIFKVTTFGESHGNSLGCIIDGCPTGILVTEEIIQSFLDKRKPGQTSNDKLNVNVTSRKEPDKVEILSGIKNSKTEGTPIALVIKNTNQNSADYDNLKKTFRPGHADYVYNLKYNGYEDYRGGGRASGRETAARVAAGAVAMQILKQKGIQITAYTKKACGIEISKIDTSEIEQNSMRAPDNKAAKLMEAAIAKLREDGDSAGGIVECVIQNCPPALGEPVFDKLDALLSHAMLSIGAIKGIEFGDGFAAADSFGSTNNDQMSCKDGKISFNTNHCGGILGGLSTGNKIIFRVAVKPVPSIFKEQETVSFDGENYSSAKLKIQGRHDVCLCPRIVPVVEAMAAITITDFLLKAGL